MALACVLASPLAFPTVAQATDDKNAPGSDCVPAGGPVDRFNLNNSIFNNSSATQVIRVDCPIKKERVGRGVLNSSVYVIDNNPDANIACELFSVGVVPNAVTNPIRGTTRSSSGASIVTRQLNLGGLPAVAGIGSFWFIGCTMPPETSIVSYYTNEQP